MTWRLTRDALLGRHAGGEARQLSGPAWPATDVVAGHGNASKELPRFL